MITLINMKFLDVLYYNYYNFYAKSKMDPTPFLTTTLTLSFSESFLVSGVIDFISTSCYCHSIGKFTMLIITGVILILNYFAYQHNGKAQKIIHDRPKFFTSQSISVWITLFFFFITTSWLFWWPIYSKNILDHCR